MKKKILAGVMLATMIFSVTACSSNKDTTSSNDTENKIEETEEKVTINYKSALIDTMNSVINENSNADDLYFKLDETGDIPRLYALTGQNVDVYTFATDKYECTQKNYEESEHVGYYKASDLSAYIKDGVKLPEAIEIVQKVPMNEWVQAYKDYINTMKNKDSFRFSFAYLDSNDVPEVICSIASNDDNNIHILSYNNGSVVDSDLFYGGSLYYKENENKIVLFFDNYRYFYSLKDGKIVTDHRAGISPKGNWDGTTHSALYMWDNDNTLTQEEYEKKISENYDYNLYFMVLFQSNEDSSSQATLNRLDKLVKNTNTDLPEWKQKYLIQTSLIYPDYHCLFSLIDLDEDSIPEMYVNLSGLIGDCEILSYQNGKVLKSKLPYLLSYNNGLIFASGGRRGDYYDTVYEFNKGILTYKEGGTWSDYKMKDEEYIAGVYTYKWDGKDVSEDEYNNLKSKAFANDTATHTDKSYSKSDITSVLTSVY